MTAEAIYETSSTQSELSRKPNKAAAITGSLRGRTIFTVNPRFANRRRAD